MAWPAPTWTLKEADMGAGQSGGRYRCIASCTVTEDEANRFTSQWGSFSPTSAGTLVPGERDGAGNKKLTITTYDVDPEDCHEDLVDDIKTCEDALEAADTQVTQANTVTTGEIATYATGKIVFAIGDP